MNEQNKSPVRDRIILQCTEIFLQSGFSKISMDEIAVSLGMSKKTIYKYFSNKEELVKTVMETFWNESLSQIDSVMKEDGVDSLLRLIKFLELAGDRASKIHKTYMEDLIKYFPDYWRGFDERRRSMLKTVVGKIMSDGKKEGVIRNEVDEDFFILVFQSVIASIANPEVMAKIPYSLHQVFKNIVEILFMGVLTKEGREKYRGKYLT